MRDQQWQLRISDGYQEEAGSRQGCIEKEVRRAEKDGDSERTEAGRDVERGHRAEDQREGHGTAQAESVGFI